MRRLGRKRKVLGVSTGKRRYDLPLNKDAGTGFLVLLVSLMTFLAVMALAGFFAMGIMTGHWSSGLENKVTVEIPAEKADGTLRTEDEVKALSEKAAEKLSVSPGVLTAEALSADEVQALISPWLGEDAVLQDIPLPGLIAIELQGNAPLALKKLEEEMNALDPGIVIDTHEQWLQDILALTGSLQFAALLITLIIGVTTFTAVAGAIRSRMEIHSEDVELLHLMGANDEYITRQFQRHALFIGLKGSLIGLTAGVLTLAVIRFLSDSAGNNLIPAPQINIVQVASLFGLPLLACLIAALTARVTVLHVLSRMP